MIEKSAFVISHHGSTRSESEIGAGADEQCDNERARCKKAGTPPVHRWPLEWLPCRMLRACDFLARLADG